MLIISKSVVYQLLKAKQQFISDYFIIKLKFDFGRSIVL